MYLFERAYVDYRHRIVHFNRQLWSGCGAIWQWFWSGPGALAIEVLLRIAVGLAALAAGVMYYRYEAAHGRGFSLGLAFGFCVIVFCVWNLLWGWKVPVHVAARLITGVLAAGTVSGVAAAASLLAVLAFSLYLVLLFLATVLSFLVFLPMRGAQELWLLYRGVTFCCPYDDCGARGGLPIHVGPNGVEYPDLLPNFYGLFYHAYREGHADREHGRWVRLPTMDVLGRKRLERLCRNCRRPLILSSIGELAERPIAVVGGPSAGKTVFLRMATRELCARIPAVFQGTAQVDSAEQQQQYRLDLAMLDRGQSLSKTSGDVSSAMGLAVRIRRRFHGLVYLFDAPGEHFASIRRFGRKRIVEHLGGIVLLLDPFALPILQAAVRRDSRTLSPSQTPIHEIVDVLISGVNQLLRSRDSGKCDVPLAVVLSKADAWPTVELAFLSGLCPGGGNPLAAEAQQRCREALIKLGEGRSVRALEQSFSRVGYFACSALGRSPDPSDSRPFQACQVGEPLLWLLGLTPP